MKPLGEDKLRHIIEHQCMTFNVSQRRVPKALIKMMARKRHVEDSDYIATIITYQRGPQLGFREIKAMTMRHLTKKQK